MTDVDTDWCVERTTELVFAAVDRDVELAAAAIAAANERYGRFGVYLVFVGLAETVAAACDLKLEEPGQLYGFQMARREDGVVVAPETQGDDARDVGYAMRFVVAHLNGDVDQMQALFNGTDKQTLGLTRGLFALVGAYVRAKVQDTVDSDS